MTLTPVEPVDAKKFLEGYPANADADLSALTDPLFRESIYRSIHPAPPPKLLPLIRDLFLREVQYRADESNDGEYFENLYWAALFLYQLGDFNDVIPMWNAKRTNMDTGVGFDIQFLVGQGVEETIRWLRQQKDPLSDRIATYITECRDAGDFENLDQWLASKINYFR